MRDTSSTSPCAACKIQRKKCSEKCILAPYFPQDDPHKFLSVHKVFGNGHIIKLLQDLPAEKRGEAVSSMVYEASERLRDPVNGCVGVINDLQNKVEELRSQLASTQAQLCKVSLHHANLQILIKGFLEGSGFYTASLQQNEDGPFLDNVDSLQLWEPLWI